MYSVHTTRCILQLIVLIFNELEYNIIELLHSCREHIIDILGSQPTRASDI